MSKKSILLDILETDAMTTVYQPIVSLKNGEVYAYEALSRHTLDQGDLAIDDLFKIARRNNLLWELEKLCRTKALHNVINSIERKILFLNVDAGTIRSPQFRSGFTSEILQQFNIRPEQIVIELTEQSAVKDIEGFIEIVSHYQSQGFNIAIDDFGSGYSGLGRVCALSPMYLKLDMNLVRNIHKEPVKKSAVSSTVEFCRQSNIKVIAEGIENEEELSTLISLNVDYGQGYYLCRPHLSFQELSDELKDKIVKHYDRTLLRYRPTVFGRISELGSSGLTINVNEASLVLYELLKKSQEITEVVVVDDDNKVIGLITRQQLFEKYSGMYGYNLSRKINVGTLINLNSLVVDEQVTIDQVAELAMQREPDHVYDAVIITREEKFLSTVSVKDILLNSIQLQVSRATDANPLTGLPGNQEIQRVIGHIYRRYDPWAIIYFDLDSFKAYNDAYGFTNGDLMLKALAETLKKYAPEDSFVGHIGGDDFVMIAHEYNVYNLCQSIVNDFTYSIQPLYSPSDWMQGYIVSKDRSGFPSNSPIATISIAVLTNKTKQYYTLDEVSLEIAAIKKKCKQIEGHSCIIQ